MKKIILFLHILSTVAGAEALDVINYDPFKKAEVLLNSSTKKLSTKKSSITPKMLSIDAILNKKVYIDGKFYGVGSIVYGYRIVSIKNRYIRVKKNGKISTILLIKNNNFDSIRIKA